MKSIRYLLLSVLLLIAGSFPVQAQNARSILDTTAEKLRSSGGIKATFEATQFKGTNASGTTSGTIYVQNGKFKIVTSGMTTWFDGRTQWTMLSGSNEVNVSNPTQAELQQLNPYAFLDLYKGGYTLSAKSATYQGRKCEEVRMTAQSRGNSIQTMIATIDPHSHMPLSVRVKDDRGNWVRIRVRSISTRQQFDGNLFRFDQKAHPDIEVIDLR